MIDDHGTVQEDLADAAGHALFMITIMRFQLVKVLNV